MEFSHVGMITEEPKAGEVFIEATRVWITDFVKHPQHVEWLRFETDSPVTGPGVHNHMLRIESNRSRRRRKR